MGITAESAECSYIKKERKEKKGVSGKMKKRKFSDYSRSKGTLTIPSTLCKATSPPKERDEMAVTPGRRGQQEAVSANEVRQQCVLRAFW